MTQPTTINKTHISVGVLEAHLHPSKLYWEARMLATTGDVLWQQAVPLMPIDELEMVLKAMSSLYETTAQLCSDSGGF